MNTLSSDQNINSSLEKMSIKKQVVFSNEHPPKFTHLRFDKFINPNNASKNDGEVKSGKFDTRIEMFKGDYKQLHDKLSSTASEIYSD